MKQQLIVSIDDNMCSIDEIVARNSDSYNSTEPTCTTLQYVQ